MFNRIRCRNALSIAIWLGLGSAALALEPASDQMLELEAARVELREVRRLEGQLIDLLEGELMTRIKAADPALVESVQRNLTFQRQLLIWSWQAVEALPPQFLPALAVEARRWTPLYEQQLSQIRRGLDLATLAGGEAAIKRAAAPARSDTACNAAQSEERICQVTSSADCSQEDAVACIDFCGGLLGFPIGLKALAGDEIELTVAGFGFNFSSPFAIGATVLLHVLQIVCNLVECGFDVTNECTRNEIRELVEQQHRHINDFDLEAATNELLLGLGDNTGNLLGSIESTRALSVQLDAQLATEQQFLDDSELFAAEQDVSRELFVLREQLCTLEGLLYRPVSEQSQVPSTCDIEPDTRPARAAALDDETARLVFSLMKKSQELPSLYLPESEGGLLELVRALAIKEARSGEREARAVLAEAERAMQRQRYREAYLLYCRSVGGAS